MLNFQFVYINSLTIHVLRYMRDEEKEDKVIFKKPLNILYK